MKGTCTNNKVCLHTSTSLLFMSSQIRAKRISSVTGGKEEISVSSCCGFSRREVFSEFGCSKKWVSWQTHTGYMKCCYFQQIQHSDSNEGNRKCELPWLSCCLAAVWADSCAGRSDGPPSFCLLAPVGCPPAGTLAWQRRGRRYVSFQKLASTQTTVWIHTALVLTATTERLISRVEGKQDAGERRRKTGLLPEQERKCRSKCHCSVFDMCDVTFGNT